MNYVNTFLARQFILNHKITKIRRENQMQINTKKKTLTIFLVAVMVMALFTVMPMAVSAATINVSTAAELDAALWTANDGDVIQLSADIFYVEEFWLHSSIEITIDTNGFSLTVDGCLAADNGGTLNILGDVALQGWFSFISSCRNATVNVFGSITGTDGETVVAAWDGGVLDITGNVSVTGAWDACDDAVGVTAVSGFVNIGGNLTVTRAGGIGVYAEDGSQVIIDGTLTADCVARIEEDYFYEGEDTESSLPGYLEFTDGTSFVWAAAVEVPTRPIRPTEPANPPTTATSATTTVTTTATTQTAAPTPTGDTGVVPVVALAVLAASAILVIAKKKKK